MKIFKFVWILIIASTVLSCANNSDSKIYVEPEPPLVLTYKNMSGTWETYYYTRSINNQEALRDPGADGVTITYDGINKTFSETNMRNENRNNGTFKILGNDTVQFFYKIREGNVVTDRDSITRKVIVQLTDKKMVRRTVDLKNGNTTVDIQLMRNLATTQQGETPDIKKELIDETRLLGKWYIVDYRWTEKIGNGPTIPYRNQSIVGTYFVFRIDNGKRIFDEYLSNGVKKYSGTYRIVDDVVFCFYYDFSEKKDVAVSLWLREWRKDGNTDNCINYSKLRDNKDIWKIVESWTYLQKR